MTFSHRPWLAGLLILMLAWASGSATLAQGRSDFPALTGRVVDQANLLDVSTRQTIEAQLAALERDTGDQMVVVTVNDLRGLEIEDYGYQLGRAWGIGQGERDNGVLLIVAPTERKVRLEVGYGLEPVLTDAFSAQIIQQQVTPQFRANDYGGGILAGVQAVEQQLRLDRGEAEALAAAAQAPRAKPPVGPIILVVLVFLFLFLAGIGSAVSRGGRRRRRGGVAPILIWAATDALSRSSRGGGGRSGGGWGGGGGFSGGGGSFGGGGASGGW